MHRMTRREVLKGSGGAFLGPQQRISIRWSHPPPTVRKWERSTRWRQTSISMRVTSNAVIATPAGSSFEDYVLVIDASFPSGALGRDREPFSGRA